MASLPPQQRVHLRPSVAVCVDKLPSVGAAKAPVAWPSTEDREKDRQELAGSKTTGLERWAENALKEEDKDRKAAMEDSARPVPWKEIEQPENDDAEMHKGFFKTFDDEMDKVDKGQRSISRVSTFKVLWPFGVGVGGRRDRVQCRRNFVSYVKAGGEVFNPDCGWQRSANWSWNHLHHFNSHAYDCVLDELLRQRRAAEAGGEK